MSRASMSKAVTTIQLIIIIAILLVAICGIFLLTRRDSKPPVAVLRANSTEVEKNTPIQFSSGDSTDNVGIVSYHWDFGDGTTGMDEDMVHSYSEVGDFTVTLTVADKAGNEEKDTMMIEVRLGAYWPTTGWRTSTPEEQGMDSELLAEALDFLLEHREEYHIESMLIIRHGYVVADVYFYPYAPGTLHDVASVTKSFTSTLVGLAIDKGYIEGVGQTVLDIFQERTVANVDASKRAITVENLLTMRSGLFATRADAEVTFFQMMATPDWVQFTLDLPMSDEPGERWVYSNPDAHLLSAIIQETTGLSSLDFAQAHLFNPLGISKVFWPSDPQGNNRGWGDLYLTSHDMAKLGYLYLHEGLWDYQQVLSASWVDAAMSIPESVSLKEGDFAYGYLWWLNSDYYKADGREGQKIFVIPEKDMVVVFTGSGGTKINNAVFPHTLEDFQLEEPVAALTYMIEKECLIPYIVQAAESEAPLPANPSDVALLESKIQQAAAQPEAKAVPTFPDIAQTVSGKTYVIDPNPYGLTSVSLTFEDDEEEAILQYSFGEMAQMEIKVGLDDVYRFSQSISLRNSIPVLVAAKGAWESDNTFVIDSDDLGNLMRPRFKLTYEGDEMTLQFEAPLNDISVTFNGNQIEE